MNLFLLTVSCVGGGGLLSLFLFDQTCIDTMLKGGGGEGGGGVIVTFFI